MNEKFSFKWATVILAAGSSSRMGRPKQLISIDGKTLIQKTVDAAEGAGSNYISVVVGANQATIESELASKPVELVHNEDWKKGMGSSLKCGLNFVVSRHPEVDLVLFLVCDQPLLSSEHLKRVLEKYNETKSPIVASFYSGKNGVPVLFHKRLFPDLLRIDDQHGAKRFIEQNPALVKSIDFPEGATDLDTPEDLQRFQIGNPRIS